jgi:hypothetical protein
MALVRAQRHCAVIEEPDRYRAVLDESSPRPIGRRNGEDPEMVLDELMEPPPVDGIQPGP